MNESNNKVFKIKVGISEFEVKEIDIPRIVEAMKNNDIVKLDCGLFRGSAILSVFEDFDEELQRSLKLETAKTQEEIEQEKISVHLKQNRLECELCKHTGWKESKRDDGSAVMVRCLCQKLLDYNI
jgi:hypothetical protein